MSYYTVTMYEYLISELHKLKISEYEDYKEDKIVFNDFKSSYVNKIMLYDSDVAKIMNDQIFLGFKLSNSSHDQDFKKMFLNRFMDNEINWQTTSKFSSKLRGLCFTYQLQINAFYENFDKYISGLSTSESKDNSLSDRQNRQAYAKLPQDILNLDVKNNIMHTADDNSIQITQDKTDGKKSQTNNDYKLENLLLSLEFLEEIMKKFKKTLFLGVH